MDVENSVKKSEPTLAGSNCAVAEIGYSIMLSDTLDLSSSGPYKLLFKNYVLEKMACKQYNEACKKKKICENVVYFTVSCSFCAYELDNTNNSCAYDLDSGTTYANQLN